MLQRVWINQPSTLQTHHNLHGTKVLVDFSKDKSSPDVYFLGRGVHRMRVSAEALSSGWPEPKE